jgi:hypothetical protein
MSRRTRERHLPQAAPPRQAESPPQTAPPPRPRANVPLDLLLMLGSFVLASALAGALGATNLGTALAFGQIAFAISLVYVLLKR